MPWAADAGGDVPGDEAAALTALDGAGFVPFVLGEFAEYVDLDYMVDRAVDDITSSTEGRE